MILDVNLIENVEDIEKFIQDTYKDHINKLKGVDLAKLMKRIKSGII